MNRLAWMMVLSLIASSNLYARACIEGPARGHQRFICMDGRSLDADGGGLVWMARRGCFISPAPCCNYEATHYGVYTNNFTLKREFARCRSGYPYHLGEMQTH